MVSSSTIIQVPPIETFNFGFDSPRKIVASFLFVLILPI